MSSTVESADEVQVGGGVTLGQMFGEIEAGLISEPLEDGEGLRVAIPMALYVTVRNVEALKQLLADVSDGIEYTLGDPTEGVIQGSVFYVGWRNEVAYVEDGDVWQED